MNGITHHPGGGASIEGPEAMAMFRLISMYQCLGMEIKGIRMVRWSVYAQAKRELGLKGNKQKVFAQLTDIVRAKLAEQGATEQDIDAMYPRLFPEMPRVVIHNDDWGPDPDGGVDC